MQIINWELETCAAISWESLEEILRDLPDKVQAVKPAVRFSGRLIWAALSPPASPAPHTAQPSSLNSEDLRGL